MIVKGRGSLMEVMMKISEIVAVGAYLCEYAENY